MRGTAILRGAIRQGSERLKNYFRMGGMVSQR
jgi:hypothetical protein